MEKVILLQGDSITDARRDYGSDDMTGHGYATMVKGALGAKFPGQYCFYNRGVSGNRITDVYARFERDIRNLKPDYISILIGVNDVWHEIDSAAGVPADKFEKVYELLIEEIIAMNPDIKIMILEPFILDGRATNHPDMPDRLKTFYAEVPLRAAAAKRVADKYSLAFVPLQAKFDSACERAPATYWLYDGVHPSAMGHELIKQAWLEAFEQLR